MGKGNVTILLICGSAL